MTTVFVCDLSLVDGDPRDARLGAVSIGGREYLFTHALTAQEAGAYVGAHPNPDSCTFIDAQSHTIVREPALADAPRPVSAPWGSSRGMTEKNVIARRAARADAATQSQKALALGCFPPPARGSQ